MGHVTRRGLGPRGGCGREGDAARRCGVPLRPPVPPQRHDCPQLRRRGGGGPQPGRGRAVSRVRREAGRGARAGRSRVRREAGRGARAGRSRARRGGGCGARAGRAAYGEEGACRGVSARSGWRVNAPSLFKRPIPRRSEDGHPPTRPRPTHRTSRATRTPTEPAQAAAGILT
ncbi:hypothetical protein probable sodium/hydrogen exchanger [Streptomyces lividans 1326]|uniref:Uncharacterized protein n=1 Tax=Streptomyces lividans 1326 TaxID=1200984 RepID=A0A7U9DSX6_STRLI|nr:hypothetical protein probable sodium/hydrogen exchanger [Streptomyces lividans 1326]